MDVEEIRGWFNDEELDDCPECGTRALIPHVLGQTYTFCFECGLVAAPDSTR